MENKENTPKSPPVSTQYVRRVLREINTSDILDEIPKPENLPGSPGASGAGEQQIPEPVPSTSSAEEPQIPRRQAIFPDIRPEVFTRERRTLRHLAGRIYLIYCHLCCLDKKFRISESDISFSDNEAEVIGNMGHRFYFGRAPELELEKMVLNAVRFSFGEPRQ